MSIKNKTGYLAIFSLMVLAAATIGTAYNYVQLREVRNELAVYQENLSLMESDSVVDRLEGLRRAMVNNDSVLGSYSLTTRRLFIDYVKAPDSVRKQLQVRASPQDSLPAVVDQ
jgi:hypothetical protein